MKFFIVFLMTLSYVHATFPKLFQNLFVERDGNDNDFVKLPFLLIRKPSRLWNLNEKSELPQNLAPTKQNLTEKCEENLKKLQEILELKKVNSFEAGLLEFFNNNSNVKLVFNKMAELHPLLGPIDTALLPSPPSPQAVLHRLELTSTPSPTKLPPPCKCSYECDDCYIQHFT